MMGGPAGRVAAVREYALRSLQACNPDQVVLQFPTSCRAEADRCDKRLANDAQGFAA